MRVNPAGASQSAAGGADGGGLVPSNHRETARIGPVDRTDDAFVVKSDALASCGDSGMAFGFGAP